MVSPHHLRNQRIVRVTVARNLQEVSLALLRVLQAVIEGVLDASILEAVIAPVERPTQQTVSRNDCKEESNFSNVDGLLQGEHVLFRLVGIGAVPQHHSLL